MRGREGDEVDLGEGKGLTEKSRVKGIFRDHRDLLLEEKEFHPRAKPSIGLFQGMARGGKLDSIARQNVELGADRITPFVSGFTVPLGGLAEGRQLERMRKVACEAAKQCRRAYLPEVHAALERLPQPSAATCSGPRRQAW